MRQPEPNRDSEAFLSALADELIAAPDELVANRQVAAAASAARAARVSRRAWAIGWAAAVAVVAVLGTGGIAAAGGLPAPLQAVVADMARALPVPIHVPYPVVATRDERQPAPVDTPLRPEDGEIEVGPYEPAPKTRPASTLEPVPTEDQPVSEVGDENEGGGSCDLRDVWEDHDELDEDEMDEIRDRIRNVCGIDFVDPPRFTDDDEWDDSGDDDQRDGEERDGDRNDREGEGGDDGDFESSDSGHWDGDGDGDGSNREEKQRDR